MSGTPSNSPWIQLRFLLFGLGLAGSLVGSTAGATPFPWLRWIALAVGIYAVVTSVTLFSMRSPTALVTFSIVDVVVGGCLLVASGDAHGAALLSIYGLVVLSALGRNLLIGMTAGVAGAICYGILVLLLISRGAPMGDVLASGLEGFLLFFILGSIGLVVRRALRDARQSVELSGRDKALEEALTRSRELAREKQQRELELFDKQRKLHALMSISRMMSSVRKPEELLAIITTRARDEMNTAIAFVMTLKMDDLVLEHSIGISELTRRVMNCRRGEGLFGEVVERGLALRLSERENALQLTPLRETMERFRNLMIVPLQAPQDKKPFGVLGVANLLVGDSFREEQEDYLRILATDASISIQNIQLYDDLERSYYEMIHALAQAIEAKDPYTHGHVGRVRDNAIMLAQELKLPQDEVDIIAKGAILHDVGKISTPNEILNKPGALTPIERKKMDDHVTSSIHILKDIKSLPPEVFEMVLFHHERFDGKGYPYGLKGDEIPLGAQIISIADAFDAMTSDRPYRKGFPKEKALDLLSQSSGTQFNPRVLSAFFAVHEFHAKTSRASLQLQR